MKFICDAMLGKLAKWLRIMGYDTELAGRVSDAELVRIAKAEKRLILTRDKGIKDNAVYMPESIEDQLVKLARMGLITIPDEPVPRRCSVCNGELEPITTGLPYGIKSGWKCKKCGKVYWAGSHWKRIRVFLKRIRQRIESE